MGTDMALSDWTISILDAPVITYFQNHNCEANEISNGDEVSSPVK